MNNCHRMLHMHFENHSTSTYHINASLVYDALTSRSVTGILHMLNTAPITQYFKKQSTAEITNYGLIFTAAINCV